MKIKTKQERIDYMLSSCNRQSDESCWVWFLAKDEKGYGVVAFAEESTAPKYKTYAAHRMMYRLLVGEFDKDSQILHTCDNKSCINPRHLYVGSHQDNVRDALVRARYKQGSAHYRSNLTESQVLAILIEYRNGKRICEIAKATSIDYGIIKSIVYRKSWKHIKFSSENPNGLKVI